MNRSFQLATCLELAHNLGREKLPVEKWEKERRGEGLKRERVGRIEEAMGK